MSIKDITVRLQSGIETGDRSAEVYINPETYTQHNPGIGDGKAAILALIDGLPREGIKARPLRAIEDGNFTCVHVEYDFFGPKAGIDVHRFESGLIVEHWDNFQELPSVPNGSGHTMIDGTLQNGDLFATAASKALVERFIREVAIERQSAKASDFFHGGELVQHHPQLIDGAESLVSYLGGGASAAGEAVYETMHLLIGEGEMVLAASEGRLSGRATAFYDLFRLKDGRLSEMWTVTEAIPPLEEWKNTNGKF